MRTTHVICLLAILVAAGCGKKNDAEPPVAALDVSVSHERVPLGSALEITYHFAVAPDAPAFAEDYRVMVHFLTPDEELMWTDDHYPEVPTSQWKAGERVEYQRTMFVPVYPYVGDAMVLAGLYGRDGNRLPLEGMNRGDRAYRVATLQLVPQTENIFLIFKDGWHPAEVADDNPTVAWQWTKKEGTIAFRNPRRDVMLYLHLDGEPTLSQRQTVTITAGGGVVDSFRVPAEGEIIRKIALDGAQLGGDDMVELRLSVSDTFVPALLPAAKSRDSRELGVRVFHAFVEPR
jgi:hypothetical protein